MSSFNNTPPQYPGTQHTSEETHNLNNEALGSSLTNNDHEIHRNLLISTESSNNNKINQ